MLTIQPVEKRYINTSHLNTGIMMEALEHQSFIFMKTRITATFI